MARKTFANFEYEPLIKQTENKDLTGDKSGIFSKYRERDEVGGWMLSSFLNPTFNKGIDKGFTMSNTTTTLGVISQCYGILTLAEYSKFDLDLGKYPDACAKISMAFNYILSHIGADKEELIFDASSYFDATADKKEKLAITDYTETVALVLKCSVEIRRLLRNDLNSNRDTIVIDKKYLKQDFIGEFDATDKNATTRAELTLVERLIAKCMGVLSKSALTIKGGENYYLKNSDKPLPDVFRQKMLYKGWTFTRIDKDKHDKCEPSLYFTYLVSDAYLAFYESFSEAIGILRGVIVDKIMDDNGWSASEFEEADAELEDDELSENAQSQAKAELAEVPLDELDREVEKVNLDTFFTENKLSLPTWEVMEDLRFLQSNYKKYREFQKTNMDAGHYVDTYFSEFDTTRDFFSYNFKLVTAQSIEDSSSSDALFNVLFAMNIMLAAGTDIDYTANGRKDEFYEALQYTIPNIQRLYKKFVREGKESVCDQYILKFNEALPKDDNKYSPFNQVKELRKQRIFAYTLTPIVIKTYTTLSKYLTPYPQYEMRMYEKEIVANKMTKATSARGLRGLSPEQDIWLWDKDGFHIITNYNYTTALRMFYDYYETYEKDFVTAEEEYVIKNKNKVKEVEKQRAEETRQHINALEEQKRKGREQLAEQEARLREEFAKEIEAYKDKIKALAEQRAPVEDAIGEVVSKYYLESALTKILKDCLDENRRLDASKIGTNEIKERPTNTLNGVLFRLILSYFREAMLGGMHDSTKDENRAAGAENDIFDKLNKLLMNTQI